MIAAEDVALVLLAAGQSTRFPGGNKLEAEFLAQPVGLHVVTALEAVPFLARFVVTDGTKLHFAACEVIHNDAPEIGMAHSVKLGVARAAQTEAKAVLIALADMPRVTATHIYRLFDAVEGDDAVVTSSDGVNPCPPAVFGRGRFGFLQSLKGDQGARDLVRAGRHVVTSPAELIDIDTPEDLERLMQLVHAPERRG
ncbi:MobA [Sphingomonas sp. EC-HK361]|uniref:nucleotidyltransferase family protein n=1 Tax=Sphingomonas sp. EC-HK361 TaxID=2038397 RepID=UPI0012543D2E|nr:nucleotidyltransferase family protein [Sphingomonas sp. EC-HK361]VVT05979.1 MobA [Sphingomonas sp. EC-HK361]